MKSRPRQRRNGSSARFNRRRREALGDPRRNGGLLSVSVGLLLMGGLISGMPGSTGAEELDPMMRSAPVDKEREADRERAGSPTGSPEPEVSMDRLLQLPTGMEFGRMERSGDSSADWRRRFRESQQQVDEAEEAVARVKAELDELAGGGAGGQWQVAPPGGNSAQVAPMSMKLREDMRRQRDALADANREMRELQIEADLADVPPEWRTSTRR